jgi:hypothetical protein
MTARRDDEMTTENGSKGKKMAKERRSSGIPSRMQRILINLVRMPSIFSPFGPRL